MGQSLEIVFFITDHGGVAHLENARCTRLPVHYSTGSNPLQSAKASDLEALTLIPAASHSAAKHPSVHSRSQSKEANWNTSRAKHRDTILRPQYWTLTTPLLKTKQKQHISEFFPRHIPAGAMSQLRKCHNSMNLETHAYSFWQSNS